MSSWVAGDFALNQKDLVRKRPPSSWQSFLTKRSFFCFSISFFFFLMTVSVNFVLASIDSEILYGQGSKLYLAGNYGKARELLAQASVLDPQNAGIRLTLGLCYLALDELQEAQRNFHNALHLDPNVQSGYLYLGISQYFLGQFREAKATLTKAKELDPESGLVRYFLGLCALQLNQSHEAINEFHHGYRLSPELASYYRAYEDLALVPADNRPKPFRLSLMTGLEYDSNIPLLTDRGTYYVRKRGSHVDWAGRLGTRLDYYPIIQPNYNLGARLDTFYSSHTWMDNWNWFNYHVEVFSNFKAGPILVKPVYSYDKTYYAAMRYSDINIYGLILDWPETSWLRGEFTYHALDKLFRHSTGMAAPFGGNERSGWEHQIGLYQGLVLPEVGVLRIGVAFERDLAQGPWITSRTVRTVLNSVVFLPWEVTWWSIFEYAHTHFDNLTFDYYSNPIAGVFQGNFKKRRSDDIYLAQFLIKKPLRKDLAFWLGYGYNSQLSLNKSYQYDRHLFQILLSWDIF